MPLKQATLENDIYISRKSNYKALERRALFLCDSKKYTEFTLHGLGAVIPRAIEISTKLQLKRPGALLCTVQTSTVHLVDEMVIDKDEETSQQIRLNSSISIHFKKLFE